MNIYVGNLSYDCSEAQLTEAFQAHGDVDSVRIIRDKMSGRSKGFGFVEMPNNDEAQAAINALDGKEFSGREIRVNEARPREERSGGGHRGGGGGGGRGRW